MAKVRKVTIEGNGGMLRLRWTCPELGKRVGISLGIPDSRANRGYAETIKDQIEADQKHGYYDSSLKKYRPKTIGSNPTEITTVELFDRFTKAQQKAKGLSQASINYRYIPLRRMLEEFLDVPAASVDKRRAEAFTESRGKAGTKPLGCAQLNPNTAKARISLLASAWDWGQKFYDLANPNPWQGLANRFRPRPVQSAPHFTKGEVGRIILGFGASRYSHYTDYVQFLFAMAARPGEASGLKWKHINFDAGTVWIGESYSRGVQGPTKTGRARTVPLGEAIAAMLAAKKAQVNPKPDDRVFTSKEGKAIDDHNFRDRAWRTVLETAGIPYRKPYVTRKTNISHTLASGANYIDVAAAAGHDPQTMHKYYAESINNKPVFVELF